MFDPDKIVWSGSGYFHEAYVLGGLVRLMIDVYVPHSTKGNAYQIRIKGGSIKNLGAKLWLPDLNAAKRAAVDYLNYLALQ